MTIFVRPARAEDKEQFLEWYSKSDLFDVNLLDRPNIYLLCAFNKRNITGFLVVFIEGDSQILSRYVSNPEASDLEKAGGSFELVKTAIFIGYGTGLSKLYFQGSHPGTNRIASHAFKEVSIEECNHIFKRQDLPVYLLTLGDLEHIWQD